MERKDLEIFMKRYPNQNARKAADLAIDGLDEYTPMIRVCSVWNDAYNDVAGKINLKNGKNNFHDRRK